MKLQSARFQRCAAAVAVGMMIASVAYAQSSEGSIYGRGKPGDKVTITSTENGASRQVTVDSRGEFSANKLPPGAYSVESGGVKREVTVNIGSGSSVDLVGQDATRVVVRGTRSRIDVSTVESSTVFTADQMAALPVARDVNMVAQLAPGVVRGDPDLGAGNLPSFSGASVAENGYYINGFDVTNLRNFLSYANLPFDAIGAQQMKSGGYGVEYGRSLGGIISIATKRGTNTWKAGGAMFYEPDSLRSQGKNVADLNPQSPNSYTVFNAPRKESDLSYDVFAGGPIIQDKLFIFGILEGRHDTADTFREAGSTRTRSQRPNGMVKVDFTPTDMHRLEFTGIDNRHETEITDWNQDLAVHPEDKNLTWHKGDPAYSNQTSGGHVLIAKYTGYLTDNLTISALAGKVRDKLAKTTGARQAGLDCPVILETDGASEIGCWAKPFPGPAVRALNAPDDEDKRKAYRFDVDYTLGSHNLRAGLDHQKFTSIQAGSSTYSGGYYYRYFISANGTVNGVPNAVAPGGQYVRRRESTSTGGAFDVENKAYYLEDNWKVVPNVLLYAGLRSESFDNRNGDGISFAKKDNLVAPRIGASWDVYGDATLKVYGNVGRYYIPIASNTNIRATQGELFEQRFYTFTGRDPRTQGPLGLSAKDIGTPQIVSDGSLANPATIADMNLKPMSQDEVILGFQKALAARWTMGMKATYRKINNGMDDYCSHIGFEKWAADKGYKDFDSSEMAQCMIVNPGNDVTLMMDLDSSGKLQRATVPNSYLGLAKYTRVYKALELTFERPWDGKWGVYGSYVWAKLRGTAEGYVNSVINQEDAGITQDFDFASLTNGSDGYLSNDRRHTFKLYGNYAINDQWRLGFNSSLQSGRPTSCIGFVPDYTPDASDAAGYTTASSYYCLNDKGQSVLHNRGTAGRTPWNFMLDLQVAYLPKVANGRLTLQADIFNVLNVQKVTEWNEQRDYSRDTVGEGTLNQNYQRPTGFQTPRSVRFSARYEF
ncbi:TonB-dependent receptor [Massilia aerilata]|uniref:TonB-dependent receptor plug domain-containing protein n=1 Tax=Massilia aerilata TaxID=453817 RepID=A0ABW0S4C5_9BURK